MDKFKIELPEFCLVAMIGATSSGKSSFAKKYYKPTEVLSSDFFRRMVSDDENDQTVSADAFDLLFYAANKRLDNMKLTVIDATNIQLNARKQVLQLAKSQKYIGRGSQAVRDFCLYGERTGEFDEYGLPVRLDWADDYRGKALVAYGHIAGREVRVHNNTYCIDTGCVFGGKLTALRYPEKEIVSVNALQQYYEPVKPLDDSVDTNMGDMLTVGDFNKKLHIQTYLMPSIDIHENNAAAAPEIMSRFSADPHWLIYLPPLSAHRP